MPFIAIFIIIPFAELLVFAKVSDHIGLFTAFGFAFLTAAIGGLLVKYQGLHTVIAMRRSLDQGQIPLNEVFEGFCLVAAGALLITPGFLTDIAGFLLLFPPFRSQLKQWIKDHGNWNIDAFGQEGSEHKSRSAGDNGVIEGDYEILPDKKK